ncbi:PEP-CTERM sorting domain-containing protein [Alteromonas sp. 5E99-2]|uniref:Npun_F0296 family exosortase-dependent surface protein n=1 Tax=Alteromonas sp. 5E99-2 TaxID=2817683 RepID=UPI001A97E45A|nr:PEP-CTERM sorting domain-containing protein [Alteromonas sp. 5E99-2]MBO1255626.1 PEP-CTERM sorting domain-containing protein [Alteromonas sp. 5E99-2]
MSKNNKLALAAVLSAFAFVGSVSAASISFGGVDASDSSGLTSQFIDPSDAQGTNGFFIETFDGPFGDVSFNDPSDDPDFGFDNECSINSIVGASPVGLTADSDNFGVRAGSISGVAAAPAEDETCFGYVSNGGVGSASIEFDYSNLLAANNDTGITYLGFYWGSVDTFNNFEFFSGGVLVDSISGPELLAALDGTSGDQLDPGSNAYVNINFSFAEAFDTLVLTTTGVATEFDNIVIGLSLRPVSAPATIALLACSMLLLSLRSRFRK